MLFRYPGPKQPVFDKSWQLPDKRKRSDWVVKQAPRAERHYATRFGSPFYGSGPLWLLLGRSLHLYAMQAGVAVEWTS